MTQRDERAMNDPIPSSPPARHFGKIALALTLAAGVGIGAATTGLLGRRGPHDHAHEPAANGAKQVKYQCPMHPTIVQDHPGECPICGMQLVPVDAGGAPAGPNAAAKPDERKVKFYRSPMDPKQTSPVPRKDEMGMDYLPVYEDELGGGAPSPSGLAAVTIDPARQQLIGLVTAPVTRGPVGGALRTVGRVAVDETRVRRVNLKVGAFVERIFVDYLGQRVRRGDPLFAVYSPELLGLENEYLLARKTQRELAGSALVAGAGEDLVAAARRRLQLWDVPDSEIDALDRTGVAKRDLVLVSPVDGVVTRKDVVEGTRLAAGAMPYEITDLSVVWVLADVYEPELPRIRLGMEGTFRLPALPGREFSARVTFVDPVLDPSTRTVKVRLALANPRGELRPEMFGEVTLQVPPREALRIPADAVIAAGTRQVVFVSLGDGKFQPREIEVGPGGDGLVEVRSGLAEGDRVVTRANFLIDSESRLRASLAGPGAGAP